MQRLLRQVVSLALSALAVGAVGCNFQEHYGCCPTDARAITLSCAGEEAIRKCPCGPDASYYGHRPTTWNHWPGGWDQYECEQCVVTTEAATPTLATTSIVGEPTPAVMTTTPLVTSETLTPSESSTQETVPIEPIDSIDADEPSAGAEEVAPIAPRDRYDTQASPAAIPAPKQPQLPSVPSIPDAPRLDVDTAASETPGLLDLPDPTNPGPSEALPWGVPAEAEKVPTESASTSQRLPTYADLFKP